MKIRLLLSIAVLIGAIGAGLNLRAEPGTHATVAIGTKVDNLTFKDIRYLPRSLNDFKGAKAYVLCFLTTDCPVALRYLPTLEKLHQEFKGQGVVFLAVNVGPDDSIRQVAKQAIDYNLTMPAVKDFGAECAKALGVTKTPEVALLDDERRLRYRGRIDDRYRLGGSRSEASATDLKAAVEDVLASRDVKTAETPVDGCVITVTKPAEIAGQVTFADHIAPLLRKNCVECHRPNTAAPFSLITYEQVAGRAKTIVDATQDQRMPPWYAAEDTGHWENKRELTRAERDLILQWVKQGKPQGDVAKLAPLPEEITHPKSRWAIGEPDLVVSTPSQDLPAEGLVDYKYVVMPYVFTGDTWISDLQILPDNPKTVHHANLAYMVIGEKFKMENFITGFVPGGEPMRLFDGVAFKIPAKAMLVLQIHYVTTGKPEKTHLKVGMRYARDEVKKQLRFKLMVDNKFAIPPGEAAHKVAASRVLEQDVVALALFTHMHVRGRDMTFRAWKPGAKEPETLLVVPNYSFDWQMPYRFPFGQVKFPKGTRMEAIAHYDNSPFNPYNPDPKATVRDGQQTHEEMLNGFFFYVAEHEDLKIKVSPKTGQVVKADKGT